jgi:hypothetical protein
VTSDPRFRDMARAKKSKGLASWVRNDAMARGEDPNTPEFLERMAALPLDGWAEISVKAREHKPSALTAAQAVLVLRKLAEADGEQLRDDLSRIEEGP